VGLTPIHSDGAYGNLSYRAAGGDFVITRTGLVPTRKMEPDNFCLIEGYDSQTVTFYTKGACQPSSECFLHQAIYQEEAAFNAIFHGHSELMSNYADELKIPVTAAFYEYGTRELAQSAIQIISMRQRIIILKDHGFVAVGNSIDETGGLVLERYRELLNLIKKRSME